MCTLDPNSNSLSALKALLRQASSNFMYNLLLKL